MTGQRRGPFFRREIERVGPQRLVGRRLQSAFAGLVAFEELAARLVIIGDQFEPRGLRFFRLMAQHQQRARHEIEQRFELAVEQRQPMLHALRFAPRADGFIKRIVIGRTEGGDIAGAEAADGCRVQRHFAGGQHFDFLDLAFRQLRFRIEQADGIQPVAEEIEPQRLLAAGRPQIDDAAAQREIARLAHRAGADIAVAGEKRGQLFVIHELAGARCKAGARMASRGGTRCSTALTVVTTTAGPESFVRRASAASVASRALSISGLGDTRS